MRREIWKEKESETRHGSKKRVRKETWKEKESEKRDIVGRERVREKEKVKSDRVGRREVMVVDEKERENENEERETERKGEEKVVNIEKQELFGLLILLLAPNTMDFICQETFMTLM